MELITALAFAKPVTKLAETLCRPLIHSIKEQVKGKSIDFWEGVLKSYQEHLNHAYEHYSYFNSIVFLNQQKRLMDYYLPLTLTCKIDRSDFYIDSLPKELIDSKKKIVIVDSAGMGKTTLLKYMFLRCVEECYSIPVYIELRSLKGKIGVLDQIQNKFADIGEKGNRELMLRLLSSGKFTIFLDGYDEINIKDRDRVTTDLNQLIEKAPNNRYILSSREEQGLAAFTQFKRYEIKALEKEEAYQLLEKYGGSDVALLIETLEKPENSQIQEFLTNPLLTSLLYKSFEYKPTVPNKKHIFYHQVFESLFETHDLRKEGGAFIREKKSGLDIDTFFLLLRCLASITYKFGLVEYSRSELLNHIESAQKAAACRKPNPSDILNDLTHAVPLMVVEGDSIRWGHKSIQEYFCASYICRDAKQRQGDILRTLIKEGSVDHNLNLLLLCREIDCIGFEVGLIKPVIETLINKFNGFPELEGIDISQTRKRNEFIVLGEYCYAITLVPSHDVGDFVMDQDTNGAMERFGACLVKKINFIESVKFKPETIVTIRRDDCAKTILVLNETLNFGFIRVFEKHSKLEHIRLFEDINEIMFIYFDFDKSNLLNGIEIFDKINTQLEINLSPSFDSQSAKKYLADLNKVTRQMEEVDIW